MIIGMLDLVKVLRTALTGIPPLTTVFYDRVGMGAKSVHALMDMLQGKNENHQILIPTQLVLRSSCGTA